jgi:hypothetical protein
MIKTDEREVAMNVQASYSGEIWINKLSEGIICFPHTLNDIWI